MKPIEQIWKEIRMIGFRNEIFLLEKIVERLCFTIQSIFNNLIKIVTLRKWTLSIF